MSEILTPVAELSPFQKMVTTIGPIPTAFAESLSYYECLKALVDYIGNTLLPGVNANIDATIELQEKFTELKQYVDDYFENLDVQEQINHKLDEMAEDGSLTALIKAYIDPIQEEFEAEVDGRLDAQDDHIANIESLAQSVASGSPAGVYATLSDLQTDNPSHTKIYLVLADGKWYYYDNDESAWTAGGTYQSTGIAEGGVKYYNLDTTLTSGIAIESMESEATVTQSYFVSGNVGSTISTTSNSHYVYGVLSVAPGDFIIYPAVTKFSYSIKVLLFCDSDDKIISRVDITDLRDEDGFSKYTTFVIPNNVTKVYFNSALTNDNTSPICYPYIIKGYRYNDTRLSNLENTKYPLSPLESSLTGIYSFRHWGYVIGGYTTQQYEVKPGDKINIMRTLPESAVLCAGCFVNDDLQPIEFIQPYSSSDATTLVDVTVTVPGGATKLLISKTDSQTVSVSGFKLDEIHKRLTVSYSAEGLTIEDTENGNRIGFKNFGGNNLFGFQNYHCLTKTLSTATDMTPAPYMIEAVNNGDGERTTLGFTGGCHAFDNTIYPGSGITAETVSVNVLCDNQTLTSGNETTCNEVTLVVVNNIQASNTCKSDGTGRSVLRETLTYTITPEKMVVGNTIKALEDIKIYKYYGLQLTGASNANYDIYEKKIIGGSEANSCTERAYAVKGDCILMKMTDNGIGNYEYNTSSLKMIVGDNKAYYCPILHSSYNDPKYTLITANTKLYFVGSYELTNILK